MTVSRRLRRASLSLVPTRQRAQLRAWYLSATAARERASARFVPDGSLVRVEVEGGPSFVIPSAVRDEIEIHFLNSEHGAELAAFLRHAVSPGLLFDVGANNGLFAVLFCQLHPANRAVGYEPSPFFADRAEAIAGLNGLADRLKMVRKAVADTSGARQLLMDEGSGRVQVQQFEGTVREGWTNRSMSATTLDEEAARVGDPSLIKIDVEGYEWEVLRGAAQVLDRARPVVMMELHLNFLEERGIPASRVSQLLTSHGYELRDLSGRRLSERSLARSWASVIHVVASPLRGRTA